MNQETAIHQLVRRLGRDSEPMALARVPDCGWLVMGERQVVRGYCLLLPDPVVPTLNDLDPSARRRFLETMVLVGDALLRATGAARINYEILGNLEPALHAHIVPRRSDEPEHLRTKPIWFHDWEHAPRFDARSDAPLMQAILGELRRSGVHLAESPRSSVLSQSPASAKARDCDQRPAHRLLTRPG